MKTEIDVEKLVSWALCDQLPKGRPVSSEVGYVLGRRLRERRFAIARGFSRPRDVVDSLGFVAGTPHPDAETISDALARLPTQATWQDEQDVRLLFGDCVGIASEAIAAVAAAVFNPQAIVVSCGVIGRRPRWEFDHPKPFQQFAQTAGRRRPIVYGVDDAGEFVELEPNRGRAAQRDGVYPAAMLPRSPIEWADPTPFKIGESRAEYVAWHWALVILAHELADRLSDFEVVGPIAAARPWIDGDVPVTRIFCGHDPWIGLSFDPAIVPRRRAPSRPVKSEIEMESVAAFNRASRQKRGKSALVLDG